MKVIVVAISVISLLFTFAQANEQNVDHNMEHQNHSEMNEDFSMDGMHKYIARIEADLDGIKQEPSLEKRTEMMDSIQKNMQRLHRQMEKMLQKDLKDIPMEKQIIIMEKHLDLMKEVMNKH